MPQVNDSSWIYLFLSFFLFLVFLSMLWQTHQILNSTKKNFSSSHSFFQILI